MVNECFDCCVQVLFCHGVHVVVLLHLVELVICLLLEIDFSLWNGIDCMIMSLNFRNHDSATNVRPAVRSLSPMSITALCNVCP